MIKFFALASMSILLASPALSDSDEEARRAFFDAENRALKFQTPDRIFPSRRVRASNKPIPLPPAAVPEDFRIEYQWQGNSYGIDDFQERTRGHALLILKNGEIVRERYRHGSEPETRFISFSTGKSFTSTLVGMAIEDGYINSVDDQLTTYLPALFGSAYEGVTIKQALQMASGVEWNEDSYDHNDMSIPLTYLHEHSMIRQRFRMVEGANALPRATKPGSKFNYSSLETCILGWLVENATGRRLATYMEERLWQPAGMEFEASWLLDGSEEIGREMAGGLLAASLRDFGRYGLLMMREGRAGDRQVISSDWVREATSTDGAAVEYGKLYEDYPLGYGYQWWLFPGGNFEAQGVYGQFIFVAPKDDIVIVVLSTWPDAWVDEFEAETYAFFEAVVSTLNGL